MTQGLDRDLGYALSQTARELRSALGDALRRHGLDDASYILLYFVRRSGPDGADARAVAEMLQMPLSGLDEAAHRLVRDGWMTERVSSPGGSPTLRCTPKCEALVPILEDAAHWAIERGLNGFDEDEIAQLFSYLERIRANLR